MNKNRKQVKSSVNPETNTYYTAGYVEKQPDGGWQTIFFDGTLGPVMYSRDRAMAKVRLVAAAHRGEVSDRTVIFGEALDRLGLL